MAFEHNHRRLPEDRELLIRIDERLTAVNESINGKEGVLEQLKGLNGRTRQNEKDIAKVLAAAAALAVIAPLVVRLIWG